MYTPCTRHVTPSTFSLTNTVQSEHFNFDRIDTKSKGKQNRDLKKGLKFGAR